MSLKPEVCHALGKRPPNKIHLMMAAAALALLPFAMVALMSGYILYETSFVLLHHRTDQPVAAAVMLFSSVATLFYYILRILMELNSRD